MGFVLRVTGLHSAQSKQIQLFLLCEFLRGKTALHRTLKSEKDEKCWELNTSTQIVLFKDVQLQAQGKEKKKKMFILQLFSLTLSRPKYGLNL